MKKPYVYNHKIGTITHVGMILALVILFNYLANFMPFGFLEFDFSLIFIVICFMYISKSGTFIIIFIRFLVGPSYSKLGYDLISVIGHIILALTTLLFIFVYWFVNNFLQKIITNFYIKQSISLTISVIVVSFIITLLNGFLFTPIYFYLFNSVVNIHYQSLIVNWNQFKGLFFNLPNYWLGIFVFYGTFNFANLISNSLIIFLFESFINKTQLYKYNQSNNLL